MVELKLRYIAAVWASDGCRLMAGISDSGGRSARTWFTRVLMSARALAPSKLSLRRTLMVDRPCTLCDSM